MTMDWDQERDWVLNNPLEAHDIICTQRKEIERLQTTVNAQAGTLRIANVQRLTALADAIPGDDKQLVAEWAVKITRAAIERHDAAYAVDLDERALAHGVANCHATIDDCPPSVRAALRSQGETT